MGSAAAISLVCGVLWAGLFYVAVRHRDAWSIVVVLLAWLVNLLIGTGDMLAANVIRVLSTGLIVALLIDRLQKSPEHLLHVASVQVQDARRDMHAAVNDRAAWEARAVAYRRLLDKHGIRS